MARGEKENTAAAAAIAEAVCIEVRAVHVCVDDRLCQNAITHSLSVVRPFNVREHLSK